MFYKKYELNSSTYDSSCTMWKRENSIIIYNQPDNNVANYAMFDLDNTLIDKEWRLKSDSIKTELKKLVDKQFRIVIITNQKGLKTEDSVQNFMKNFNSFVKTINIKISLFASLKDDRFRKPKTGVIDEYLNLDKKSFYCGDAAGREKTKDCKKDFADTDYKFAINLNIKFYTPESFFTKETRDPSYSYPIDFNQIEIGEYDIYKPTDNEVVIMCGFPGCGKSYYVGRYLVPHNYYLINQDTLKTKKKVFSEIEKALTEEKRIVIDNTNYDKDTRRSIIEMCKRYRFRTKLIHFTTDMNHSKHNSHFRSLISDCEAIPDVAYRVINKKFIKPSLSEGLDEIVEQKFIFNKKDKNYKKYKKFMF